MASGLLDAAIDQAVQSTFETYFFLEAIIAQGEAPPSTQAAWTFSIDFRGPLSGSLLISLSAETARGLVDVLPLSAEGHEEETIRDVFAEVTNTIAGRIVAALAGDQFAFDLSIPECSFGRRSTSSAESHVFQTDCGNLEVCLIQLDSAKIRQGA